MDSRGSGTDAESTADLFFDALDSFPSSSDDESRESLSPLDSSAAGDARETPPPGGIRRRRLPSDSSTHRRVSAAPKEPTLDSPSTSTITASSPKERRSKPLLPLQDHQGLDDSGSSMTYSDQVNVRGGQRPEITVESPATSIARVGGAAVFDAGLLPQPSILELAVGFVIKAVSFQVNLLISCVKFPVWLIRSAFLLVTNPFGTLKFAGDGLKAKLLMVWKGSVGNICPFVVERLSNQQGVGKLAVRVAWGCFWSTYVCFVLSGLLAASFLGGKMFMERVVDEPVHITQELSFDYTKPRPDARVPIVSCSDSLGGKARDGSLVGSRLVPPNHKLQVTIALTLPESDYNKRLGVFQVRVEFLSVDNKVISTSSRPCMLRFKSSQMHLIETFFRSIPLLSGYSSESQVISIKMKGFTEGNEPAVCLRVILEQRAEFRSGAGIPEIYFATLKLESELPLFKRMIWNWRRTLFVWTSMTLFIFELLIVLVCCRPIVVPTAWSGDGPPRTL